MAAVRPIESKPAGWLRPASMIVGIYICPVVLLLTGVIPFELRFHVLVIMSLLAVAFALSRHSVASLGLSLPRFRALMLWSVLPSVLLIGTIILLDLPRRRIDSSHLAFYFFFVFVSAPAQEFLYRVFCSLNWEKPEFRRKLSLCSQRDFSDSCTSFTGTSPQSYSH